MTYPFAQLCVDVRPQLLAIAALTLSEGVAPWSHVLERARLCLSARWTTHRRSPDSPAWTRRVSRSWNDGAPCRRTSTSGQPCRVRVRAGAAAPPWGALATGTRCRGRSALGRAAGPAARRGRHDRSASFLRGPIFCWEIITLIRLICAIINGTEFVSFIIEIEGIRSKKN